MALAIVVFFLTIAAVLWIFGDMSYLSKPILKQFAFTMALGSFMTWAFLTFFLETVFQWKNYQNYIYLLFIPFFIIGMYHLKKARKIVPLSVQANQQRYWEEIKASDVYKFFLGRKEPKRKKIVIRVNEGEKKFFKSSELIPDKDYVSVNFFRMLKRIEKELTFVDLKSLQNIELEILTILNANPNAQDTQDVKSVQEKAEQEQAHKKHSEELNKQLIEKDKEIATLKEQLAKDMNDTINQIPLYKAVFDKIKFFIREQDIKANLVDIFVEDKGCVEFFLLDLWERYTKRVNIGTANLVLLAEREIEEEFIGAMDNVDLYSVKAKGAALYYRYMVFMGRVDNYLKKAEQEEEKFDESLKDGDFL